MVSPRKSSSALSLIPEDDKLKPYPTKSCESLYSNSSKGSAHIVYDTKNHKKQTSSYCSNNNNNMGGMRHAGFISATTEVRQRVLSARRLRMKTYQNQLADAQQTIAGLAQENRILRTLHKRQDSALSKYESTNAELPQLLHSHAEEMRVWQTKYRNLQANAKDLEQKLKQKEQTILTLSDQNKYYIQLNKDKNLEDRQRLTDKYKNLEQRLQEKDNDLKMMARKMQLEAKNFKQQLQMEQRKTKEVMLKLEQARIELSGYRKIEELQLQEKFNGSLRRNKLNHFPEEKEDDTDEPEMSFSQRSITAANTQRTNRTMRKLHTNNKLQVSNRAAGKTISSLKHIDCGGAGGDGSSNLHSNIYKSNNQSAKQLDSSPATTPKIDLPSEFDQKLLNDYEDDYEEHDADDLEDFEDHSQNLLNNNTDGSARTFDNNLDYGKIIDADVLQKELNKVETNVAADNETDFYGEEQRNDFSPSTVKTPHMKEEEMSSFRKQISNDYNEREAFLDTFCRQATKGVLREDLPKKRNSIATQGNVVPSNRKHKLLAALKAIDDNKSQD